MGKITVNIQEIQQKLCDKLKPSNWFDKLKGFILSNDFEKIIQTLVNQSNENKKFTPPLKQVFRGFEECDYKKLKVIFLGQDCYPQLGIADGIAFSCSNTMKEQPSLRYIFDAIENQYSLKEYNRNVDLSRWSNQGILLINCGMTCTIDSIGSHIKIWSTFLQYLLDTLNSCNSGLIFVFLGKEAQEYNDLIDTNIHYVLNREHPATAYYNKGVWNYDNLFKQIDEILLKNNNEKIVW